MQYSDRLYEVQMQSYKCISKIDIGYSNKNICECAIDQYKITNDYVFHILGYLAFQPNSRKELNDLLREIIEDVCN